MHALSRRHLFLGAVVALVVALSATADPPAPTAGAAGNPILNLHILAINDLEGGLEPGRVDMRPAGGAAALAAHFNERRARYANTLAVHSGDIIGAAPPISSLLREEPSAMTLDLLGIEFGAVGNHEFDRGLAALRRLQHGGCDADDNCFPGIRSQYLAANVIETATGQPIFPPYLIRAVDGVRIGFIGVVTTQTPGKVTPSGVAGLQFLDEAETINRYAAELKAMGVRSIIVLIHEGGRGDLDGGPITGAIARIAEATDPEVDVFITGDSHTIFRGTVNGILMAQAGSKGIRFMDFDLDIDRNTGDIVRKDVEVVVAYADTLTPDPTVAAQVAAWADEVRPLVERVVGTATEPITRQQNDAGESALGNLIADSQRAAGGTQIACMNPGGIRTDLPAGEITFGDLVTVQPFNNFLITMTLTGAQIERLLNQQWDGQQNPRILQCSGMTYTWDASRPEASRVSIADIRLADGTPLRADERYTVTVNSFLAEGGDNFTVLRDGINRAGGDVDVDVLAAFIETLPQPFTYSIEGRIMRRN